MAAMLPHGHWHAPEVGGSGTIQEFGAQRRARPALSCNARSAGVGSVVAEGRDIGTVVFPQAQVKIFLDASSGERARRRYQELLTAGRKVHLAETLREMEERDKRDSERDLAPLRQVGRCARRFVEHRR